MYTYCWGNPLKYYDPSGHSPRTDIDGGGGGGSGIDLIAILAMYLRQLATSPDTQADLQAMTVDAQQGDTAGLVVDAVSAAIIKVDAGTSKAMIKGADKAIDVLVKGENHHIASDKSIKSGFTKAYEAIFKKAGMSLQDEANIIFLDGHSGAHTKSYKQYVLEYLTAATEGLTGKEYKEALVKALDDLKAQLKENPKMPYKGGLLE